LNKEGLEWQADQNFQGRRGQPKTESEKKKRRRRRSRSNNPKRLAGKSGIRQQKKGARPCRETARKRKKLKIGMSLKRPGRRS